MWRNHSFSQRNRTTERTVGVEVRGDREVRERKKSEKEVGVKQCRGSSQKRRVRAPLPTM